MLSQGIHRQVHTLTEKPSMPGRDKVWCSRVACFGSNIPAHSVIDREQDVCHASNIKQTACSLEKAEWNPLHNIMSFKSVALKSTMESTQKSNYGCD